MSAASEIVADCARLGVVLEVRGDRLRYEPASAVPADLGQRMRDAKPELLAILAARKESLLKGTAKTATGPLPSVLSGPIGKEPQEFHGDEDAQGRPRFGCSWCGCRDYARDLADHGWVCTACHEPGESRAHVARWTAPNPSRRGAA